MKIKNSINRVLSLILSISMVGSEVLPALASDVPEAGPDISMVSADEAGYSDTEESEPGDEVTGTADDAQPDAEDDGFVFVPGYVEVPNKTEISVAGDGIGYYEIESSMSDSDEEPEYSDDYAAAYDSAYPCSYTQTGELRSYLTENFPPVRNQNPYGTCWAHSAIGLTEFYMIKHGMADKSIDLSELHTVYYCYNNGTPSIAGDTGDKVVNNGGDLLNIGGNLEFAAQTMMKQRGPVLESDVPYEDAANVIYYGQKIDPSLERKDAAYLKNAMQISFDNPEVIKEYIVNNGLVGVSIQASESYYNSAYNSFYCSNTTATNHAVSVVGWDDDFPADHFSVKAPGNGAWLVRNSWNYYDDVFSYYEYFWLSYYDKSLTQKNGQIVKCAWTYEMMPAEEFPGNSYYYDSQIHLMISESAPYSANIYKANSGADYEKIEAVTFSVEKLASSGTGYEISIYTGVDPSQGPASGKLQSAATTKGTLSLDGQYTVKLKNPVYVKKGKNFAVVIKRNDNCSIGYEYNYQNPTNVFGGITYYAYAKAGQSFKSNDGSSWTDVTNDYYPHGNFIIGALTSDVSAEDVDLGSITLSKSNITLTFDKPTAKLGVTAVDVDGTEDKDPDVTWESLDTSVATVDNGTVSGVASGKTKIIAKYGKHTAECDVTVDIPKVEDPVADPDGGSLRAGDIITVSCSTNGAAIYYTLDGSEPTKKSTKYKDSISVNKKLAGKSFTLKLRGFSDKANPSNVVSCNYTVESLSGLKLSDSSIVIERVDETKTITATVYDDEGEVSENAVVSWNSSDPSVATVENGIVTATASGNAVITAEYGAFSAECSVSVLKERAVYTGLSISPNSISFNGAGQERTIEVTVTDQYGDKINTPKVSFESSDTKVAVVSDNGVVRSVSTGNAVIGIKAGSLSEDCTVTVTLPQAAAPVADPADDDILPISSNIVVSCSTNGAVVRYTLDGSDPDESSVSVNGAIAVSSNMAGKTFTLKLRAYAEGYDPSDISVYVYEVESREGLVLSKRKIGLTSAEPEAELNAAVYRPDGSVSEDAVIEWSSSDTDVVTVDNGRLTAGCSGNAIVTATAAGYTASCNVTVVISKAAAPEADKAEGTELSLGTEIYISCGTGIAKIYYTLDGSEPSESSASANGVIIVDKSLAGKSFTLKLRAFADHYDPSDVAEYHYSVEDRSAIELSDFKISFTKEGEEHQLTALVHDAAGDVCEDAVVSWNSSDPAVATVDNGRVTAVASGNAVITAGYGSASADCAVLVKIMSVSEASVPKTIVLDADEISLMGAGSSRQLKVVAEDQYGLVIKDPELVFSSSNTRVAVVDEKGLVTALTGGSTVITVKSGNASASCRVNVVLPKAAKPVAEQSDGALLEVASAIVIRCATEKSQVYYTLDGKDPTKRSLSVNGAITVTEDMAGKIVTLKLRAYADGYEASDVVTYTYKVGHDIEEYEPYAPVPVIDEEMLTIEFRVDGAEYFTTELIKGTTLKELPEEPEGGFLNWVDSMTGAVWNASAPVYREMVLDARFESDSDQSAFNTSPDLTQEYLYLVKGQKVQLDKNTVWESDDKAYVTVSKKGVLTAKKAGPVTMIHSADRSVSYYVYVVQPKFKKAVPSILTGCTDSLDIELGAYPEKYPVAWSSSSPAVAAVNGGEVYGVAKGSATITAVINGKSYSTVVKVKEPAKVTYDSSSDKITLPPLQSVSTKIKGEWKSNEELKNIGTAEAPVYANAVVSITAKGKITAIGSGVTTLTAPNGKKLVITVNKPSEQVQYLALGKKRSLKFTSVKNASAKWESTAPTIASVNEKGKVTAIAGGWALISCTYKPYDVDGSGFTFVTRIYAENPDLTATEGIKRIKTNSYEMQLSKDSVLPLRFTQKQNYALYQPVVFKSDKPAVAYADESGVIHALTAGKAKLSASVNGKKISITVVVEE